MQHIQASIMIQARPGSAHGGEQSQGWPIGNADSEIAHLHCTNRSAVQVSPTLGSAHEEVRRLAMTITDETFNQIGKKVLCYYLIRSSKGGSQVGQLNNANIKAQKRIKPNNFKRWLKSDSSLWCTEFWPTLKIFISIPPGLSRAGQIYR